MEYRDKLRVFVGAGLLALVFGPWAVHARVGYGFGQAWLATLTVDDDATVYADGYSDARWGEVREGMPVADVVSRLGPPLDHIPWEDGVELWSWSEQANPPNRNWHVRRLLVGADGRVLRKIAFVFVD